MDVSVLFLLTMNSSEVDGGQIGSNLPYSPPVLTAGSLYASSKAS